MALKRDATYPNRFKPADDAHPQGGFKNRSSAQAKDGSYLEEQWLDDLSALSGAILRAADITLNNQADTAIASQVMQGLMELVMGRAVTLGLSAGSTKNNYTLVAADKGQLPASLFDRMRVGFKVPADKVSDAVVNIKVGAFDSKAADGEVVEGYNEFVYDADADKFTAVGQITGGVDIGDFVQLIDIGAGVAGLPGVDGSLLTGLPIPDLDDISGIGSYAFVHVTGLTTYEVGNEVPGSILRYASAAGLEFGSSPLPGRWKISGRVSASTGSYRNTLVKRVE